LGVTMALESIVDVMCPEIFPLEKSDLRSFLPRKRGASAILIGVWISMLCLLWYVLAQKQLLGLRSGALPLCQDSREMMPR
jgi:hypothetical protein